MNILKSSGRSGFLWPGLNVPLTKSGVVQTIGQRSKQEQEKVEADMIQQREDWERKRKIKVKRERGWSGSTWGGVSIGPPSQGPNGGSHVLILLAFAFVTVLGWFLNFFFFYLPVRFYVFLKRV